MANRGSYRLHLLVAACIASLIGCGDLTQKAQASEPPAPQPGAAPSMQPAGELAEMSAGTTYRMKLHKAIDKEGTGKLAVSFLIPAGWNCTDVIKWIPDNFATPVVARHTIKSPDGLVTFDTLSGLNVIFTHGPAGNTGQAPPREMCDLLIKSWKMEHPGLECEVVSRQDTPVKDPLMGGTNLGRAWGSVGVVKLRYQKNGRTFMVKGTARYDAFMTNPEPTAIGGEIYEGSWMISNAFSVTATEDKLAEAMKVFGIVLTSSRADPHFYNIVVQAQQIIQQNFYARQRQIMETSRIISQTNDAISDTIMGSYRNSQAAADRAATNFDDYIRGVDKYQDSGGQIGLPSGYAHAWADQNGNYVVTDQPLYNPNTNGQGGNWHELSKAH